MTDTEILDAIIEHKLWVHPTREYPGGWAASGDNGFPFVYNKKTLREAIEMAVELVLQAKAEEERSWQER